MAQKLAILADAAKYDASCASSGAPRRNSLGGEGIGSTTGAGICHAYAPDGRCISLLKILLTNFCSFDCLYCVNRASSNVPRARFTVDEVVTLTLDFYKRNYIEGLFLSSGIIRSPDHTMAELVRVARVLREQHDFRGYIHLKTIPDADPQLLDQAGRFADRLSINIELPKEASLRSLAPEKNGRRIRTAMADLKSRIDETHDAQKRFRNAPRFSPAGQSTQMIVGADDASDADVLTTSASLYAGYGLRRVYYSAFSPIPDSPAGLPPEKPPLMREHRLYQADWLLRHYGFSLGEIVPAGAAMLDLAVDPKLGWALRNRERFPVDVNRASREELLRIPGLGVRAVDALLRARRFRSLGLAELERLTNSVRKIRPFILAEGWRPTRLLDRADLAARVKPKHRQPDLFA
jgi:putative DNA modification/repair radical SAM protein